jgi:hypothetical protein
MPVLYIGRTVLEGKFLFCVFFAVFFSPKYTLIS